MYQFKKINSIKYSYHFYRFFFLTGRVNKENLFSALKASNVTTDAMSLSPFQVVHNVVCRKS